MAAHPAADEERSSDGPLDDDQLRLLFLCCHPALSREAQVALTLRMVGGLRTPEIARLFLVGEATMGQRLSRAKAKVRDAGVPFRLPPEHQLPERTASVLACIHLVFTEGYAPTGPEVVRTDLCVEAIRLAELVVGLMPDDPEARGLLALLLLQDSRRATRTDAAGELVLLEDQDRARWDHAAIERGTTELDRAARRRRPGPYQLQAAIAAGHAEAPTWADTDWSSIARCYEVLGRLAPSPIVEVNRAVAVGHAAGPQAGLRVLDAVADDARLRDDHRPVAVRAHLLELAGDRDGAERACREALDLAPRGPESRALQRRLDRLEGTARRPSTAAEEGHGRPVEGS